ncbi:MAG TPA: hypothetical protein VHG90_03290 [Acidimicrobiales bacterium]|nr:hypothetical protein [Acidimicrobiales bacterium]
MRRTSARRVAPIVLVLVAGAGLLGAGQKGDGSAAAVLNPTTAVWAATAGVEAVLPAKLETAFERSGLTNSPKQRPALAVLVLPLLLACAVSRRASLPWGVPARAALCAKSVAERGPPLLT